MSETRFRVGTYINDDGDEKWQVERFYPKSEVTTDQWILFGSNLSEEDDALKVIRIFRLKEAHDPNWKEV